MKYSADPRILRNEDDAQIAWDAIEPFWDDLPLGKFDELSVFMGDLTQGQRGLVAVDWCQKDIRNGGIAQFFMNSTGDLMPWAIEGFRMIGADKYAEILAEAASTLGPEHPMPRGTRKKVYKALQASQRQRIDELENDFFALIGSQDHDLERYRGEFVRRNPREFVGGATGKDSNDG